MASWYQSIIHPSTGGSDEWAPIHSRIHPPSGPAAPAGAGPGRACRGGLSPSAPVCVCVVWWCIWVGGCVHPHTYIHTPTAAATLRKKQQRLDLTALYLDVPARVEAVELRDDLEHGPLHLVVRPRLVPACQVYMHLCKIGLGLGLSCFHIHVHRVSVGWLLFFCFVPWAVKFDWYISIHLSPNRIIT